MVSPFSWISTTSSGPNRVTGVSVRAIVGTSEVRSCFSCSDMASTSVVEPVSTILLLTLSELMGSERNKIRSQNCRWIILNNSYVWSSAISGPSLYQSKRPNCGSTSNGIAQSNKYCLQFFYDARYVWKCLAIIVYDDCNWSEVPVVKPSCASARLLKYPQRLL